MTVALLCLPAGAVARPGDEIRSRSLHLSMSTASTKGYDVSVETLGHHRVILTAERGGQVASYMVRGKVSRHRIKADFGRFGRVRLRFHGRPHPFPRLKTGNRNSPARLCRGRKPQREIGRFHGAIEFDGQRGFTRLAVGGVKGELRRSYRQVCRIVPKRRQEAVARSSAAGGPSTFTIALLSARARVGHTLTRFSAINLEPPAGIRLPGESLFSIVVASVKEKVGRVRVFRSTFFSAGPGQVKISRRGVRPAKAKVALGPPFEGTALFKGGTDASPASWMGSLGVRLPGTGLLPLTGPHFRASLCRVSAFQPRSSCYRRAEASITARAAAPTPSPWR